MRQSRNTLTVSLEPILVDLGLYAQVVTVENEGPDQDVLVCLRGDDAFYCLGCTRAAVATLGLVVRKGERREFKFGDGIHYVCLASMAGTATVTVEAWTVSGGR